MERRQPRSLAEGYKRQAVDLLRAIARTPPVPFRSDVRPVGSPDRLTSEASHASVLCDREQ
jgi:hypothetical protein